MDYTDSSFLYSTELCFLFHSMLWELQCLWNARILILSFLSECVKISAALVIGKTLKIFFVRDLRVSHKERKKKKLFEEISLKDIEENYYRR